MKAPTMTLKQCQVGDLVYVMAIRRCGIIQGPVTKKGRDKGQISLAFAGGDDSYSPGMPVMRIAEASAIAMMTLPTELTLCREVTQRQAGRILTLIEMGLHAQQRDVITVPHEVVWDTALPS